MATQFRIIGIKPLCPTPNETKRFDNVERIQKALYGQYFWHYLYQGFDIDEKKDIITGTKESVSAFSLYNTDSGLRVSISAIVGKNGKGKSSVVDLIIRIINNLSAALMGEGYNFTAAEHLHFIDNVFASMAFQIGGSIYIIEERARKIKLKQYRRTKQSGYIYYKTSDETILDQDNTEENCNTPLKKSPKGRRMLKSLFYTFVCNYSLYGFNYREYKDEATPTVRLNNLAKKKFEDDYDENHSWLKGIFHKNDGYQTPIVLHPMRNDGMLDIVNENHLANERMAALLFYKDQSGNMPFRNINGLQIIAIKLLPSKSRRFTKSNMLETLSIGKQRNISKYFDGVYASILKFWDTKYNISQKGSNRLFKDDACDYIVYKTLKIISNYKKYSPILRYISRRNFDEQMLAEKLESLSLDYSHVTKKLLQAINYLRFDIYHPEHVFINLIELDEILNPFITENEKMGNHKMLRAAFLPPPIFDTEMELSVNDDYGANGVIPFDRLSSGEKQNAYTISNFLYHLVNIDSAWNDLYRDKDHYEVIKYHYVNVIFDEVELYFHPDMQRRFVQQLVESLRSVHFSKNIRGINIILATHSPFILSDIPHTNILQLGEKKKNLEGSFGANVITLLADGFFMDYTIGEFARKEIESMVSTYYNVKERQMNKSFYDKKRQRFKFLCSVVSDPYLKDMVTRMFNKMEQHYKTLQED